MDCKAEFWLAGNYAFLHADIIPRLAYIVASSVVTLFVNFVVVTELPQICVPTNLQARKLAFRSDNIVIEDYLYVYLPVCAQNIKK